MNNSDDARNQRDLYFMQMALTLAKESEKQGEVPIGALIIDAAGKIIGKATNLREKKTTVLGHAELVAIHRACKHLGSWRLNGCTLYVTLEPCFMCAGALVQSRIQRVVFGAYDPKGGALGTLANLGNDTRLNHSFEVTGGTQAEECGILLSSFFKNKRAAKKVR